MGNLQRREKERRRRHHRIRRRISGTSDRPRLVVSRSLKNISAQIVDDSSGTTLVGVNSQAIGAEGNKVEQAKVTGRRVAEVALELGISAVVFDRGGYLYHGRVQALAEGARDGGLEF